MSMSAKRCAQASFSRKRPSGLRGRGGLTTACLVVAVALSCTAVARHASAMFVNAAAKSASPPPAKTDEQPTPAPSPEIPREDVGLQRQIEAIETVPTEKRRVNSNTFSRMSGQTENLKPVVTPASSAARAQAPPPSVNAPPAPSERIFTIGSWAFVLACVGAAALGLLKIRKLTSSG
jgi:hypothetical protein